MIKITTPIVVIDHNAKTAIVLRTGRKFIHTIPMKSGKLTVRKITEQQYESRGYEMINIGVYEAVEQYLAHSGGHTDTAKHELLLLREIFDVLISAVE